MKLKTLIIFIVLLLSLISCTIIKKVETANKFPISSNFKTSENAELFYKLPDGWREISDNNKQLFELWLTNKKNNSTIVFIPIHLDNSLIKKDISKNLQMLKTTQVKIKQAVINDFRIEKESDNFSNSKTQFIAVEYFDKGNIKKSVFLEKDNKYYECLAYFNKNFTPTKTQINNLFEIQKEVLLSLQIKKN